MSLRIVGQDDFAAGIIRGVAPDVQPGVGLANAINGLYNDDGDVYRRGGTRYFSPTVGAPLTFIWSGYIANVPKLIVTTATGMFTVDPAGVASAVAGAAGLARPVLPAILQDHFYLPNGVVYDGTTATAWSFPAGLPAGPGNVHLCAIAGRLVVARGNRIAFSEADSPGLSFLADDFHTLPDGVVVMGLAALRDTLLAFTNFGLWTVTNMAYNLTDDAGNIQQSLSLLTPEVSLWDEAGIAEYAGRIVATCIDRAFLIDGLNQPVPITDSIAPLYLSYVNAGYRPGGAKVFRGHLLLPILNAGVPVAALVCRLDRPVQARRTYFPWSTLTGHALGVVAADVALIGVAPGFLAAHHDGRIANLTDLLNPSEAVASDADGTAFEFDIETRDFPTGNGQPNHVRKLRLRYTLEGPASILAGFSYGSVAQTYEQLLSTSTDYADVNASYVDYEQVFRGPSFVPGGLPPSVDDPDRFWYTLYDQTPPDPGVDPVTWQFPQARRVRYVRFRFRTTDAPARLVLHHLDFHVRQAAHDR